MKDTDRRALDRRTFLRKAAQVGVATAWATPVLSTISAPSAFATVYPKDFSYVALCYTCDGGLTRCCVKFDLNDDGTVMSCEVDNFRTPKCPGFTFDDNDNDCGDCSLVSISSPDGGLTIFATLTAPGCQFVEGQGVGKCGNPPENGECVVGVLSPDKTMTTFEMCGV